MIEQISQLHPVAQVAVIVFVPSAIAVVAVAYLKFISS